VTTGSSAASRPTRPPIFDLGTVMTLSTMILLVSLQPKNGSASIALFTPVEGSPSVGLVPREQDYDVQQSWTRVSQHRRNFQVLQAPSSETSCGMAAFR